MNKTQNHSVTLSKGEIFYQEQGQGRVILFVHGAIANSSLWQPVLQEIRGDCRCIAPDWPLGAHRKAMNPDAALTVESMADLIVEFIDKLSLKDVVLVGNDSGGAITQILAARYPDKISGFVLTPCDAYECFPPFWFTYLKWLGQSPRLCRLAVRAMLAVPALQRLPNAFGGLFDRHFDTAETTPWLKPMAGSLAITRDLCSIIRSADPRQTLNAAEQLKNSKLPALLLWTINNPFFKLSLAQRLQSDIPNARLETIAGKSTFISMDQPLWVAQHINAFIDTLQETEMTEDAFLEAV